MTDETPDAAADTGTATAKTGRPRPQETVERDAKVLAFIKSQQNEDGSPRAVTREEIAAGTDLPGNQVYLSLYRLRVAGEVARGTTAGAHRWSVVTAEQPQPA